jgi:acetylornithine deacetylase/succinyl-diaminopimelate desuccinylase-like protein
LEVPNLSAYVEARQEQLQADACIWEFGGVDASGRPMTYCGLKGILTLELSVRTASFDLHSSNGAVVENPIYRLSAALASLRDKAGRILIEGFYDDVEAPTASEERALEALPHEDRELAEVYGTASFLGDVTGTAFQRKLLFEPAINFNGFHSGYGGPGSKTVLPAEATAKLDLRLVPKQDPDKILHQLEQHLKQHGFSDIQVRRLEHFEHAARADLAHPFVIETVAALQDVYGVTPTVYPNSAGSGPMYPFIEVLGLPVVGIGCGYPGSRIHSP